MRNLAKVEDAGPPAFDASATSSDAGVPISDADKVVASLRPQFRACYNAGLRIDRTMEGCVVMTARIASDGTVASNEVAKLEGLSDAVAACLADALRGATFSPPGGAGSTLNVPVTFVQAEPR